MNFSRSAGTPATHELNHRNSASISLWPSLRFSLWLTVAQSVAQYVAQSVALSGVTSAQCQCRLIGAVSIHRRVPEREIIILVRPGCVLPAVKSITVALYT